MLYTPMKKQDEFHRHPAKYKVYAGGMGSGKTMAGCAEAILLSVEYPGNFGLIGRATYPELRDTTWKELLNFPFEVDGVRVPFIDSPLVKSYHKAHHEITLTNGSTIIGRALDDSFDKLAKGLNLGWFYGDELTELAEEIWVGITAGRLRLKPPCPKCGKVPDGRLVVCPTCKVRVIRHQAFGTTNPEGHDWVWKRFYQNPDMHHFCVQASSEDNAYLPEGYVDSLKTQYPEEWVKRYVYGSFDTFEGLVYKDFKDEKPWVIEGFDIPDDWYRFVAVDHGYRNPTAVLWFAVSDKGDVYCYDEFYASGKLVSEIATVIQTKTGKDKIQMYLIDPSCGNRSGKDGRSIIDEFQDNGLYFTPANNEVRAGINRVQEYLKLQPSGKSQKPKLQIFRECLNLRTELQTYRWKDMKVGTQANEPEKPLKKGDHACFVAGTMVKMANGSEVAIENLIDGDEVLTPNGYTAVRAIACTGIHEVYEYDLGAAKLIATPNHPVYTYNRGFVEIDDLREDDLLCVIEREEKETCQNLSRSMVLTTEGKLASDTSAEAEAWDICTVTFGNTTTAKYPMDTMSTTSTGTRETIRLETLRSLKDRNTSRNIRGNGVHEIVSGLSKISLEYVLSQKNGMVLTRGTDGTLNMAERSFGTDPKTPASVTFVGKITRVLTRLIRGSVPTNVGAQNGDELTKTTLSAHARPVARDSRPTSILTENSVLGGALAGKRKVYNITTDEGVYFANGVLTHNCDTLRYGVNYLFDTPVKKEPVTGWRKWMKIRAQADEPNWMAA